MCAQCEQRDTLVPLSAFIEQRRPGWKRLAPPRRPHMRDDGTFGCLALLFTSIVATGTAVIIGAITAYTSRSSPQAIAGFGIGEQAVHAAILTFMVAFVICFYVVFSWNQKREVTLLQPQLATWQQMIARWQTLLYCEQCDRVFSPTQNRWTPATEMRSLLSDEPLVAPDRS
ncbi:MAG: hypothetical protein HC828_14370 [Blastochloris sp.]|nr:hypothetical protein [Blastochloris sp.]